MRVAASERVAEWAGPIVVKEVRQGLRAKVFAICFGLLLLACLVVALIAAADTDTSAVGPRYLMLFQSGLALICFFVIPYGAFRSMAREREDETWVLLVLTGLSSRRIVRGKIASALSQAILYSSAGAPFMVFSYFLNGVDLVTLLLVVMFASVWAVFLTCLAVALGTEGSSRIGRGAIHFLVLSLLAAATAGGLAFGVNLAWHGSQWFEEEAFRLFIVVYAGVLLSTSILLVEGAAAGLTLTSEASVKAVRVVILLQQVVGISASYLGMSLWTSPKTFPATVGSIVSSLMLVMIGVFAVSEPDGFPRVERGPKSWLTGGALRGWKLILGLLLVDTGAWVALHWLASRGTHYGWNWDHHELAALLAAPLYVAFYLCLAVVVGRLSPLKKLGEPSATRIAFGATVAAAMIFSPLAGVLSGERANFVEANFLNPFFGMINFFDRAGQEDSEIGLLTLGIGVLLLAPFAWAVLKARDKERNA